MSDTYAAITQAANSTAVTDTNATLFGGGSGVNWSAYMQANPDVASAYQNYLGQGLKRTSVHMSEDAFAEQHYNTYGKAEGRPLPGANTGGLTTDAKDTAANIVATATDTQAKNEADQTDKFATLLTTSNDAYNKAIDKLTTSTNDTLDRLAQGNKDLSTQTTDAITAMNKNSNDAIARMSAAMDTLRAPQARKQPNLIDLFRQNKARMGRGNGSTFLTGPGGTGAPGSNLPIGVNAVSGVPLATGRLGA